MGDQLPTWWSQESDLTGCTKMKMLSLHLKSPSDREKLEPVVDPLFAFHLSVDSP